MKWVGWEVGQSEEYGFSKANKDTDVSGSKLLIADI